MSFSIIPKRFQRISLKKKFFLILILTSSLSLLFACSALVINDILQIRDSLVQKLTDQAGLVGENSSAALVFDDPKSAKEILEAFKHQPSILQAILYTPTGKVLAQFRPGKPLKYDIPHKQLVRHVSWESIEIFRPIFFNHDFVGTLYLQSNLHIVRERLIDLLIVSTIAMFLSSLLAIIISSQLQKSLLSPLVRLTEVADRISRNKDYSLRAPTHAPDEIGILIDGFNTMLQEIQEQTKELDQHRSHLSELVTERTAEVSDTNIRLQDEIIKRERIAQQVLEMADNLKIKNEELALSRDAALQAARAKSEFLAMMSHEIRTPMNGIIGMTDLLLGSELSPSQSSLAHTVQTSAESLLTLLNDILDFSKIEAGKLDLESIDFDLGATIEASLDLLAERAANKNLELTGLIFPDVPTNLRGDPGRMRQILLNLLGNSIKFTENGEVSAHVLLAEDSPTEVELRFHIWDTGIGISPEAKQKLFQAFTQADSSTTRKFGGTGLGLAISQQLVQMMGGEIGIESQQNEWTLFWFSIRLQKPHTQPQHEWIPRTDLQGLRICCIDDNPTNLFIIQNYAHMWGMQTFTATDPEIGFSTMCEATTKGQPFDLALIDRNFPQHDGIQFGRRCKQDPSLVNLKLVLLTSVAQRGEAVDAEQAGFDAYLTKPIHKFDLHNSLATVMGFSSSANPPTPRPLVTRHTIKEAQRQSRMRILIVDDHAVNQQLMALMLERIGLVSDIACNGREAVAAVETGSYALILMDCQMPEMDGYEATQKIREDENTKRQVRGVKSQEQGADRSEAHDFSRIPIIALTANAMRGDREKCIAAGMDDYLTKPIRPEELAAMLDRWLPSHSQEQQIPQTNVTQEETIFPSPVEEHSESEFSAPVDTTRLQEWGELGGQEFVTQMVEQFVKDVANCVSAIEKALDLRNDIALAEAAHGLKGISANIGATQLHRFAVDLEQNIRQDQPVDGPQVMEQLQAAVSETTTFLAIFPSSHS